MYQNKVELSMKGRDYRNLDQTSAISIVPTLVTNFMLSSTLFQYFHKAVFPSIRSALIYSECNIRLQNMVICNGQLSYSESYSTCSHIPVIASASFPNHFVILN